MPAFLTALVALLSPLLISAAGRILTALGIGIISYAGLTLLTDGLFSFAQGLVSGVSSDIVNFIYLFKVLPALKLISSAYIAKFTISGMKKFVLS